jgi:H+/Cl- antiporter ClcA
LLLADVAMTFATAATVKSGESVGLLFPSIYLGALAGVAALTSIDGVPLASIALLVEVLGSE